MDYTTICISLLLALHSLRTTASKPGGKWDLLQSNTGVSAMHMQLLHTDRVVIFDRTDFGKSNISLPNNACRDDPNDSALKVDCTAHSIEYAVPSNSFRPLTVLTDTWCSSGSVSPSGVLLQTGGFNDGDRAARSFSPCSDGACDWTESNPALSVRRWYASNHVLPDGRAVVLGGRRQFSYEFHPKSESDNPALNSLLLLRQAHESPQENNLYPFVHLNVDGNLFVFANNRSVLLDYKRNAVVRTYPVMPGGPRNYPSSGSSVLLPLRSSRAQQAEVMICGGAPPGSFDMAQNRKTFWKASSTCGRLKITETSPSWVIETMPMSRVMGDMVLLPTGRVLIINGAGSGTAGWENAEDPVLNPVTYSPNARSGSRFQVQNPSTRPRLYHSTAILLRDGRVLVGGSNPHTYYQFYGEKYPTELSLEAFSPDYLDSAMARLRPKVTSFAAEVGYAKKFTMEFTVEELRNVTVTMIAPPFTTHSYSMNQRLLVLDCSKVLKKSVGYSMNVSAPGSSVLAPPGYYMVFIVNGQVPSEGVWVHIQ